MTHRHIRLFTKLSRIHELLNDIRTRNYQFYGSLNDSRKHHLIHRTNKTFTSSENVGTLDSRSPSDRRAETRSDNADAQADASLLAASVQRYIFSLCVPHTDIDGAYI